MARAVLFDMDGVLAFTEQFYNQRRVDYLVGKGFRFDAVPDFSGSNAPLGSLTPWPRLPKVFVSGS